MARCFECGDKFIPTYFNQKHCDQQTCIDKFRQQQIQKQKDKQQGKKSKAIKRVSDKRKDLNEIYKVVRIEVLAEAKFVCFVDGCKNVANTCEHLRGRKGFADDWARENNIPLLIDKRYLRACCLYHNLEFERNPDLSKKYQLSQIHEGKKL